MSKIISLIGEGAGKTTSAVGRAIRMLGQGKPVKIIQFMKGRQTGEFLFLSKIENIDIHLAGPEHFLMPGGDEEQHKKLAKQGLDISWQTITNQTHALLILDEVFHAVKNNFIHEDELLRLLEQRKDTHIILTGRYATSKLLAASHLVTRMEKVKHYFEDTRESFDGLDY